VAASNQFTTRGIVLARTDYNEADRIITFLTPNHGKVRAIAKAVRKSQSKLAGGIELFSVSDLTFVKGRGEIYTLISSRLQKHYGQIVKNLDRTNAGYELISQLSKATEDQLELAYFDLLKYAFEALNDESISLDLIRSWFAAQLLKLAGHSPNLRTDINQQKLIEQQKYEFNFDSMAFQTSQAGRDNFAAPDIKFLRLIFSDNQPKTLQKIAGIGQLANKSLPLLQSLIKFK